MRPASSVPSSDGPQRRCRRRRPRDLVNLAESTIVGGRCEQEATAGTTETTDDGYVDSGGFVASTELSDQLEQGADG